MPPDMRRGYAAPFKLDLGVGCALGSGFAPLFIGQRLNQGRSPNRKRTFDGAAEPRLTSGGEAATTILNCLFGQSRLNSKLNHYQEKCEHTSGK